MANHNPSPKKLQDKVAIITGGASGIGATTARVFIEQGARFVVIADVQDEMGKEVASSIGSHSCSYVHCDVTVEKQVEDLVRTTVEACGQLDIMFCNAGVITFSDSQQCILDLDLQALDKLFAVNVRGVAAGVKHAARAMVDGRVKGSIVCNASISASRGTDNFTDYTMSKHAMLGLVRSGSRQLGSKGIRVNCVSPGAVATPMLCRTFNMEQKEVERTFESTSYLDGVLKERHVADAVVFLASDESAFVTGHNLVVDGGLKSMPV